ncbi:MAG: hypothetical protein IJZ82_09020 [Lachnospiraceae bacterium]|nr:hypothetical protein [Lachnospiraceae bacterium]
MKIQTYEDYKYVMVDTSFIYLGAKYTYGELLENEDVAFKLRTIFERYIMPELSGDTTLEEHFQHMEKDLAYKTYKQLKIKLKISKPVMQKNIFGKTSKKYISENVPLDKYLEMRQDGEILVQEVVFGKLALMSFAV